MNIKTLNENIIIKSTTAEQWQSVQNILTSNGYKCMDEASDSDTFDKLPYTAIYPSKKGYMNIAIKDADRSTVYASVFIVDNSHVFHLIDC